jgi:hypothetical protein
MKVLPLNSAYPFGESHGFGNEIAQIRDMEIELDRSCTSSLRRGYIIEIFQHEGIYDEFKEYY